MRCDLYIGFVYLPPEGSAYSDIDNFQSIQNDIEMFVIKGDVIISGDLNCRTGRLNDFVAFDKAFDFLNEYVSREPFKKDRKKSRCSSKSIREEIDRTM